MPRITNVHAREILDSRGIPTVETEVIVDGRFVGRAAVPSGLSTGSFEACEKRDKNPKRFLGKGVQEAVNVVNSYLSPLLHNWECSDQSGIDAALCRLDGTERKERLGANAILSVSCAVAKAASLVAQRPLFRYLQQLAKTNNVRIPCPMVNLINGGAHADTPLDTQEVMFVPLGAPSFSESLRWSCEVFYALKAILKEQGFNTNVGDEGGFSPSIRSTREALDLLCLAIEKAGYTLGKDVYLALDMAASECLHEGIYHLDGQTWSSSSLIAFYDQLSRDYPLLSIEDGLGEEDWDGWFEATQKLSSRLLLVGDDLFVTSPQRLEKGIKTGTANAILIKPNQIGTLTETLETCQFAKNNAFDIVISHRSGETEDTFLADLCVAVGNGLIKTGSVSRSERCAKYNQLLRIEECLGTCAAFGPRHLSQRTTSQKE